jgi:hypothetical protein
MHGLLNNVEVRYVNDAVAVGASTDDNSTRIDMSDYESVLFVVPITDSVATGVATLKVEGNSADSDTGMAAITNASATATSATNDDLNGTVLAVEVINPGYEYVQAVITSGTANIAFGATVAYLVPRRKPATQGATVTDTAIVAD